MKNDTYYESIETKMYKIMTSLKEGVHLMSSKERKEELAKLGFNQVNTSFFDTLQIKTEANKIKKIATKKHLNFFYPDNETVTISVNETTSITDINEIIEVFASALKQEPLLISSISESIPFIGRGINLSFSIFSHSMQA